MIWIFVSSYLKTPGADLNVVKGCGDVFSFSPVNMLKIVVFPTLGNPVSMHCASSFFIPSCPDFPDFFCLETFAFSFFIRVLRFASIFSAPLCLGHSFIIISKHCILSSSVAALRKSSSAL